MAHSRSLIPILVCLLLLSVLAGCSTAPSAVCTISYDLDGGTLDAAAIREFDTARGTSLPIPEKIGYRFCGWQLSGGQTVDAIAPGAWENVSLKAVWEIQALDLPVLSITLDEGVALSQLNKTDYRSARLTISGGERDSLENCALEIRGRGNSSWMSDKKSYKLKFAEKQNLFHLMGENASKHWAIVGNYSDNTLSKNNLAYTLAREVFTGIPYTTGYQNVDLYVNGEYQGVYSVYETVRAEKGRVDIESSYDTLDTGFLLEYDMLVGGQDGIDYFCVNGLRYPIRIDSPAPDEFPDEQAYRQQVAFIYRYLQEVFDAISGGNFSRVCELVDIDSVIDVYLMHELFKNSDVGLSSFYMYKEAGGKLFFGPVWDFDKSCQACLYGPEYTGLFAGVEFDRGQITLKASNPFFYLLMQQDAFVELVRQRWAELCPLVLRTVNRFVQDTLNHTESFQRNFVRWPEYADGPVEENIADLGRWLQQRALWLRDYNWQETEPPHMDQQ